MEGEESDVDLYGMLVLPFGEDGGWVREGGGSRVEWFANRSPAATGG